MAEGLLSNEKVNLGYEDGKLYGEIMCRLKKWENKVMEMDKWGEGRGKESRGGKWLYKEREK